MVHAARFSCCNAKIHFFYSYMTPAGHKWTQLICGVIRHYEYELQDSNIEEIKQQLAGLRQTINTAFERRDFRLFVSPGRAETLVRWGGKTNHHSQQNICQKLPKSVDVHWRIFAYHFSCTVSQVCVCVQMRPHEWNYLLPIYLVCCCFSLSLSKSYMKVKVLVKNSWSFTGQKHY